MDMPLLANIYRKRVNKGSSSGSGSPKERKGGLGSNKGAARYKRTSAEERKRINSDGRFGYFDEVNKRYIPAFIDFMDGGGRDTRDDTFEGGGPLSGIANDLGIKPYGSQRDRMFGGPTTSPIMQAVSGISDSDRISASMAEQARQRGLSQDATDPRMGMTQMSSMTMGATPMQQQAMQRASAAQAEQVRMAALIDEARGLAARSGLDFNTMPQERQAEFINAVRFGIGGPTSGRF